MPENPTLPPPQRLHVPMSDGAVLAALRYPGGSAPSPVVVTVTPYRKEAAQNADLVAAVLDAGYDVVVADVRGFGGSTGPYRGVLSERESLDTAELLEWLADQDFCDGRTAMVGGSYCGVNQLLAAVRRPRGLRCIAPWIAPTDTYRDMWKRGGIPSHTAWGARTFLNAQREDTRREGLRHFYSELVDEPFDTDLFHRVDLDRLDVPALFIGGWQDYFLRGTVRGFRRAAGPKRLLVGNWSHEPFLGPELRGELVAWLDFWLRDRGEDPTAPGANARLSVFGTDEWTTRGGWPEPDWARWEPVAEPTPVAVAASLLSTPPAPPTAVHPLVDLATESGMRLWGESAAFDLPVTRSTALLGHVGLSAVLSVEGCDDVDLHARLSVVRAGGEVQQVTEGRLRASHRAVDAARSGTAEPWHPHDRAEKLPQGEPVVLDVEVYPVHLRLEPGDALRLGVTVTAADESGSPATAALLPGTVVLLPGSR
ncbi:CocE/NonD family hydrolase [Saccharothrix algeriensis]|uniref:Acyl esterase n=1 Tax=Saccharothrix algeriensis TaxID=173560 RepID=A0A8T8I3D8_9PSEU|nr:CocE/NonD family hydrolase [Saccharothrix algeriensis]MBM7811207.1 putative acyl esterase [Saccharothrix algeriensis]QTR05121.1 CocE/NonD family hydrolase [Saccharothrix algeriensis]